MQASKLGACCIDSSEYDNQVLLDTGNMNKLGRGWKNNHTKVSLYIIFRGISGLCGASHWAWILESNELGESDFFCSIEYGQEGIVIRTFPEYDGIENAFRGCMGNSYKVFFKRCITNRSYGEILSKVDEIKGNWKGSHYILTNHNCRYFAIELGEFLINRRLQLSDSYNFDDSINVSIAKKILLNENEIKDMFGSSWKKNPTKISLELVRNLSSDPFDSAWIIIGDKILCSIKYDNERIVMNRYVPKVGLDIASRACFPGSTDIEYKEFSNKKPLKDILNKLEAMHWIRMQRNSIEIFAEEFNEYWGY
jgi:hypothetical protein